MKRGPPGADERDTKKQNTTAPMTVEREYKEVRTNYWPLEIFTNKTIFKYHFEFADGKIITEREQLGKVFRLAFNAMGLGLKENEKISRFIWGNSLFMLQELPAQFLKQSLAISEKGQTEILCQVIISGPDAFSLEADVQGMQRMYRRGTEGQEYEMVTRKEGSFVAQIINILFKPILIGKQMALTPMGRRGYFDVNAGEGNDRNYSFMPGFNPVVVLRNNRLFLHTDFQYRAIARENSTRFIRNEGDVQSVYCEHNRRHYIVTAVRKDMTPFSTFTLKDGTVTTYAEYYQKRYGLRVRDNHQPLLEVTQRRKQGTESIYLVPEFCKVAGIPRKELQTGSVRLPTTSTSERYHKLSKFINNFASAAAANKFTTVKMSTNCYDPQARLLRPQDIKFNGKNHRLANTNVWDDQLRNNSGNKLLNVPVFNWEIWVTDPKLENDAKAYYSTFTQCMRPLCSNGIKEPTWVYDKAENIRHAVTKTKPAVVLVILPRATAEPYVQVKRDLLLAGVPAQIVVHDKFMKGNRPDMSKVTKAGLQLLAKAGAVLWSTTFAANDPLSNKLAALHTCVFGIERSINKKSGETTKLAATCTVDRDPTTFSEYFNYHVGENANSMPSLQSIIERGLEAFKAKNNRYPGRLVLYSSGASEGALQQVVANDIKEVNSAIAELYKGTQPEVLYVLVCRSGTTRLFIEEGGAAYNVKPGTVVDRNICNGNEFYLVSHDGGQKSVLPPKYILAHHEVADDKKQVSLTMKDLQRLSFGLCHLYYNWPGPISCPAPLKYADKLAKLVATAGLPSRPDNALATKLFYI